MSTSQPLMPSPNLPKAKIPYSEGGGYVLNNVRHLARFGGELKFFDIFLLSVAIECITDSLLADTKQIGWAQ